MPATPVLIQEKPARVVGLGLSAPLGLAVFSLYTRDGPKHRGESAGLGDPPSNGVETLRHGHFGRLAGVMGPPEGGWDGHRVSMEACARLSESNARRTPDPGPPPFRLGSLGIGAKNSMLLSKLTYGG